ncbi:MAG: MFS transporter [Pseudomonadota bacterium]|uniref:MFS transporter n=1 Tax=Gallaecimonas pentaromativorans TaxID=584787 RepID=UPI00067EBA66|nr:MFS transporter [Gallaecimonas pentaromativorans]MED5526475.1 MFS transporter [Pseudomonadota bacterium]
MQQASLPRSTLFLLAMACAMAVANIYYNQPLLALMGESFGRNAEHSGQIATVTQMGYALGLLMFVPLGDLFDRRKLLTFLALANGASALVVAAAPSFAWLLLASALLGLTAVSAQIIIPAATAVTDSASRGAVIGTLLSGLSAGLLFARTLSGAVGDIWGWRTMFVVAAVLNLVLLFIVRGRVPAHKVTQKQSIGALFLSLWTLIRTEPVLRRASLTGFCFFAAFSSLWGTLAELVSEPPLSLSVTQIGSFGLVGIAGLLASPYIGRAVDRWHAKAVTLFGAMLVLLAFALIGLVPASITVLLVAMALVDIGNRSGMVSNQHNIYSLSENARSRLNTLYMVCYFLGGASGTAVGSIIVGAMGWVGLSLTGIGFILVATVLQLTNRR